MKLSVLFKRIQHAVIQMPELEEEMEIRGITCNSQKAEEDSLFVCIQGSRADGHDYIDPHKQWSMWFNSTQREEPYKVLTSCDDAGNSKLHFQARLVVGRTAETEVSFHSFPWIDDFFHDG